MTFGVVFTSFAIVAFSIIILYALIGDIVDMNKGVRIATA
jgi:hypothetical protein